MRSEITLGINFRQALIIKHSIEKMIEGKQDRLNVLMRKNIKSSAETCEGIRLQKDICQEVEALSVVNGGLDIFHDETRRRKEVQEYAQNLPTLLEEVERHNRHL